MAWLRETYASQWRLHEDPSVVVHGRYVFLPEDAPHVQEEHYFGARVWYFPTKFGNQPGELDSARHVWTNGQLPNPRPLARMAGSPDCFLSGEKTEGGTSWASLFGSEDIHIADPFWLETWLAGVPSVPGAQEYKYNGADRTVVLASERLLRWYISGTVENWQANEQLQVVVTVDGLEVQRVNVTEGGALGGPFDISRDGQVVIPTGEHVVRVETRQNATPSYSGVTAKFFAIFEPGLDYSVSDWIGGFPKECYAPAPFPPVSCRLPDYVRREDRYRVAQILERQYTDQDAANQATLALLGEAELSVAETNGTIFPSTIIAKTALGAVVFISGTDNFQLEATEPTKSLAGPRSVGQYSTWQRWYTIAGRVLDRMNLAGVDPDLPLIIAGYSHGAGAAAVLAARCRVRDETRRIDALLFGCPKIGDWRLLDVLARCYVVPIAAVSDPIPSLPLRCELFQGIGISGGSALGKSWANWKRLPTQELLFPNGSLRDSRDESDDWARLQEVADDLRNGINPAAFDEHTIETYRARLELGL